LHFLATASDITNFAVTHAFEWNKIAWPSVILSTNSVTQLGGSPGRQEYKRKRTLGIFVIHVGQEDRHHFLVMRQADVACHCQARRLGAWYCRWSVSAMSVENPVRRDFNISSRCLECRND
jgi:hypothetical protein